MLSFLERRLLLPLFHEVVGKHGQTIGERLPRLLLRANDERIASALNLDFVAFQLKFAGNPYGLTVAAHKELGLLPYRHCKIVFLKMMYTHDDIQRYPSVNEELTIWTGQIDSCVKSLWLI